MFLSLVGLESFMCKHPQPADNQSDIMVGKMMCSVQCMTGAVTFLLA